MTTQAPSKAKVLIALFFALSCFVLTLYVYLQFGGSIPLAPQGYRFHARFSQAAQLLPNSDVRISGVNVGKVIAIKQVGERTDATIQLDNRYVPLPADAHAILRAKTLLGETYVELSPGDRNAPKIPDGGMLRTSQVQPTQQLDQILDAFDAPTRQNLKRFLIGFSNSLSGRGADLNNALGNAGDTTTQLSNVVTIVNHQSGSVQRILRDGGTVLQTLGERRADLQRLITSGDQVLSATAARNRELTATVQAVPPFMRELRPTLVAVDQTARQTAPTLAALRPSIPLLRPALDELVRLVPRAQALVREANPFIDVAHRALPAATRMLDAAHPTFDVLYAGASEIVPIIDLIAVYRQELVAAFANQGAATEAVAPAAGGRTEHYLRTLFLITPESFIGYPHRLADNRHNPYYSPGELANLSRGGLLASDCRNAAGSSSSAPPCRVQPPWTFKGATRYYPHLLPAVP